MVNKKSKEEIKKIKKERTQPHSFLKTEKGSKADELWNKFVKQKKQGGKNNE